MTFEQFTSLRRPCLGLAKQWPDQVWDDAAKGWTYADAFWIQQQADGWCWTLIGNQEYSGTLIEVERLLWDNYARAELND